MKRWCLSWKTFSLASSSVSLDGEVELAAYPLGGGASFQYLTPSLK